MDYLKSKHVEKLKEELRNSTETVLEQSNSALIIDARTQRVLKVNRPFLVEMGVEKKDVLGKKCHQVIRNFSKNCTPSCKGCPLKKTIRTGKKSVSEFVYYCKGKKKMYIEVNALPFSNKKGKTSFVLMVFRDISVFRQAEEALRESEELYRTLAEGLQDMIFIMDHDRTIKYVNDYGAKQFGFTPKQLVGQNLKDFSFLLTRYRQHKTNLSEVFKTGKSVYTEDKITLGNRTFWLGTNTVPIKNEYGMVTSVMGIARDITEQKTTQLKLMESEGLYRTLSEAAHDIIYVLDRGGTFTYVNKSATKLFGIRQEQITGKNAKKLVPRHLLPVFEANLKRIYRTNRPVYAEDNVTLRGKSFWFGTQIVPLKDGSGMITAVMGVSRDITRQKYAEETLKKDTEKLEFEHRQFLSLLDSIDQVIYVSDPKTHEILYVNNIVRKQLGKNIVGKKCHNIFYGLEKPCGFCTNKQIFGKNLGKTYIWDSQNTINQRWYHCIDRAIKWPDGKWVRYEMAIDVHEARMLEDRISHLSYHDILTGLPNRTFFKERLVQEISSAQRRSEHLAVLMLDMDKFKEINDTLGHDSGNLLLQSVAKRLEEDMGSAFTIGRMGGDEFALILTGISGNAGAEETARKVLKSFIKPFVVDDQEVRLTASIGISVYPSDGDSAETIIKNADIAMSHAKWHGRNIFKFFAPAMSELVSERRNLEISLRKAIDRKEFTVYYQPEIDIKTNEMVGMEALVRWHHPELGLMLPLKFIPLAEETGLIINIGEWVLRSACEQNKAWHNEGFPKIRVAVNLSASQFQQENLVEMVSLALKESGLAAEFLELEITESTAMQNLESTASVLRRLHDVGVHVAIDDFGIGYSSLSYLKKLPINRLKIDQSFIKDITTDPDDKSIVKAIIALAHSMKLIVVAEGVETDEQLAALRALECDEMQGFLYREPVPVKDFYNKKTS